MGPGTVRRAGLCLLIIWFRLQLHAHPQLVILDPPWCAGLSKEQSEDELLLDVVPSQVSLELSQRNEDIRAGYIYGLYKTLWAMSVEQSRTLGTIDE
jgi:hypothetical protein